MKSNLLYTFLWLCGVATGIFLTLTYAEHHNARHAAEPTNAPNLQIVRHGPLEIEVRDVNIPPPGYGVATNGVGEFAMVLRGLGVMDIVTFKNRPSLLADEWRQFDVIKEVEASIAAKQFHVSEPPK